MISTLLIPLPLFRMVYGNSSWVRTYENNHNFNTKAFSCTLKFQVSLIIFSAYAS